jgi:hypothetical protein
MMSAKPLLDAELRYLFQQLGEQGDLCESRGGFLIGRMGKCERMDLRKVYRTHGSDPRLDNLSAGQEVAQAPSLWACQDHHDIKGYE